MPNRQLIQLILIEPPKRHEPVHQGYETGVVGRFQQMNHLMHDDVFQAFRRLLRKLGIKPDAFGAWTTTAPLRFHPLGSPYKLMQVVVYSDF
jgi:hypothetical protein